MSITLDWIKDQQYVIQDDTGHGVVVESKPDGTSSGFSPSQLLLAATAGCMANHVLSILQKKRLPPLKLRVAEHPKRYVEITLTFEVHGEIPLKTVEDTVTLAKEKYCSVLNSLDPAITVITESRVVRE